MGILSVRLARHLSISVHAYEKSYTAYYLGKVYTYLCGFIDLLYQKMKTVHHHDHVMSQKQQEREATYNVIWYQQDLLYAFDEIQTGDLCILYLCPQQMQRISEHLNGLKKSTQQERLGFYIVSVLFALPNFEVSAYYKVNNIYSDPIYFYRI